MKKVKVGKSKIHGKGLFTTEPIKKGELILPVHSSLPIDQERIRFIPNQFGKFYNHDEKNFNTSNEIIGDKRYLRAIKNIPAGSELTANYKEHSEMEQPEDFGSGKYASFDFDKTIATPEGLAKAKKMFKDGYNLFIVSAREKVTPDMIARARQAGIPVENIIATGSDEAKVRKVKQLGVEKHFDDKPEVIAALGSVGEQFRKGGGVNSMKYTRSIFGKNKLFVKNKLFKPKKVKNRIYDPNAKYYEDGGELNDVIEIDIPEEDIQRYIDGGYVVEEMDDPSIPALNQFDNGGSPKSQWIAPAERYSGRSNVDPTTGLIYKDLGDLDVKAGKKGFKRKVQDFFRKDIGKLTKEAEELGKGVGYIAGVQGDIEPAVYNREGIKKFKSEVKRLKGDFNTELKDAEKKRKQESDNKSEYDKWKKKLDDGDISASEFLLKGKGKNWEAYNDVKVAKGTGSDADYSATAAGKEWGDSDQWNKFTGLVSNAATAIPLLGAAGAMGSASAAILENPYVQAGLTAYGVNEAVTNTLPEAYKDFKEGRYWEGLGNTALGALDFVPGVGLASKGAKLIPKAVNYAGDLAGNIGKGFKTLSKAESQGSILSKYRNIEELRHAKGYKDFKSANEAYPELFPTQESFMQAKNEANALLKEYTPKFEKQFGKGKDDEILVFGAHDDVGKLNSKEGFLVDDEFAKSTGLENDLTNQQKFLGDTYQLEYSGYFNQNPGYGGNKEFAKYLSNQIEPVIGANKLKAPAQVRRTSSFNRPVKTMRGDQELTLNYDDLLEGDVIYPEHNWSTTTDMTGNVWGSGDPTSKVAIINVPEGQSAFRPNMYTGSQYVAEQELLLPSKLGYRVSGVNTKGFGSDSPRFIFDVHNPYKYGGALNKFIEGGDKKGCPPGQYWNGKKCTRLITLKDDRKYIDGVANWAMHVSDPNIVSGNYNDQIKNRLYSGKWGLDPETGALVNLSAVQPKSVTTLDAKTKASREKEKLTEQNYKAEEENKKVYEQSIIGAGFDPATFGKAKGVNTITGEPIYASSKEEADRINQEAINQFAIEGHAAVVNNPVFKAGAYMTPVGMAIGAMEGLARFIPDATTLAQDPTLANAGQLGIDALQVLPFSKPIANTVKSAVQNTHKINPWRFKANPEAYYHRTPNLGNIINTEKGVLQGFGQSEAGLLHNEAVGLGRGSGINLRKAAHSENYFSKGVPLDFSRYNSGTHGYPGPYIVEVTGVPFVAKANGKYTKVLDPKTGQYVRGELPPVGKGQYAVAKRPVSLDEVKFYKEHWLYGYKEVPKQLPGSPNVSISDKLKQFFDRPPGPMMLLGPSGGNMVKKNMNYYKQLLDSYDGKKMSASNRKFYNDLIESGKKQDGMLTEAQLRELDRLKNSNFDFGKKAYAEGGSVNYQLGDEIDENTMNELKRLGYTFEEI